MVPEKEIPLPLSRREFLQVVGASAVLSPTLASAAFRADDATVVRHASIGASGMGWADLGSFASHPAFRLAAIAAAGPTRLRRPRALGAPPRRPARARRRRRPGANRAGAREVPRRARLPGLAGAARSRE